MSSEISLEKSLAEPLGVRAVEAFCNVQHSTCSFSLLPTTTEKLMRNMLSMQSKVTKLKIVPTCSEKSLFEAAQGLAEHLVLDELRLRLILGHLGDVGHSDIEDRPEHSDEDEGVHALHGGVGDDLHVPPSGVLLVADVHHARMLQEAGTKQAEHEASIELEANLRPRTATRIESRRC